MCSDFMYKCKYARCVVNFLSAYAFKVSRFGLHEKRVKNLLKSTEKGVKNTHLICKGVNVFKKRVNLKISQNMGILQLTISIA